MVITLRIIARKYAVDYVVYFTKIFSNIYSEKTKQFEPYKVMIYEQKSGNITESNPMKRSTTFLYSKHLKNSSLNFDYKFDKCKEDFSEC